MNVPIAKKLNIPIFQTICTNFYVDKAIISISWCIKELCILSISGKTSSVNVLALLFIALVFTLGMQGVSFSKALIPEFYFNSFELPDSSDNWISSNRLFLWNWRYPSILCTLFSKRVSMTAFYRPSEKFRGSTTSWLLINIFMEYFNISMPLVSFKSRGSLKY